MRELLPPKAIDREAQHVRLVLLAGSHARIAARVCRWRADAAPRPFGRLITGVAPALVVVRNWPAAVQVTPDGRVRVRQRLGADFGDKRRAQTRQVSPVSLGPALAAVQVLVAGPGEDRPRWVERAHQRRGFFVHVAIELLRVPLPQPGE